MRKGDRRPLMIGLPHDLCTVQQILGYTQECTCAFCADADDSRSYSRVQTLMHNVQVTRVHLSALVELLRE